MSKPTRVLTWIVLALAAVAVVAALLHRPLLAAFNAAPAFNAMILAVFGIGVLVNLRQVFRLDREVRWIEAFRRSDPDHRPREQPLLLRPMAQMLSKRQDVQSLSPASTRSILDTVYLRLEEARDLSRYLTGLLIFLGLLGTFWGLLRTIASVGDIIAGLGTGGDALALFDTLKEQLKAPLSGMATSFSTSLLGLSGSLVVGFLDLQTGAASNRFYNELEEWLAEKTRLSSGATIGDGEAANVPAYVQALLEQTADGLERMQRALVESERERRGNSEQMSELNAQLARLADSQTELRNALLRQPHGEAQTGIHDDLRSEFRLLSRTIAAAMNGSGRNEA